MIIPGVNSTSLALTLASLLWLSLAVGGGLDVLGELPQPLHHGLSAPRDARGELHGDVLDGREWIGSLALCAHSQLQDGGGSLQHLAGSA